MFKRRTPRTSFESIRHALMPKGGWRRQGLYMLHRLRRLPDTPHAIARGLATGVFISFSPLFGLHFVLCTLIIWLIRGNFLASVVGNWFGNPVTLPFIALSSVSLGQVVTGQRVHVNLPQIMHLTGRMSTELWDNLFAPFTSATAHWDAFVAFGQSYFMPYLIGGLILGTVFAIAAHETTWRTVAGLRQVRVRRLAERRARREAGLTAPPADEGR